MSGVMEVEVERLVPHPVEAVFARYTDHAGWSEWAGVGPVRLVREGAPQRDGVGAVRAFAKVPPLREEVVAFDPPRSMEYRVVAGGFPLADHLGAVRFESAPGGTRVVWRVTARWRLPGTEWLASRALALFFGRLLASLERDLDRSPARG